MLFGTVSKDPSAHSLSMAELTAFVYPKRYLENTFCLLNMKCRYFKGTMRASFIFFITSHDKLVALHNTIMLFSLIKLPQVSITAPAIVLSLFSVIFVSPFVIIAYIFAMSSITSRIAHAMADPG